ncbi:MAG TPA: DUF2934 domain-containing protein [Candidatus Acidoferrales bacterium]|nr:DUF2934 domain-containing protein [Candidatus Acidoferrales bacterium]
MDNSPSNQQIEARAYEIYLERGRENGHDVEDWLAAEKELSQRREEVNALFDQEQPEPAKLGYAATASARRK